MQRQSNRFSWPLLALSVALCALALPATSALASEPRVVVAGSAPIPPTDTISNKTIATSFDVVLAQPNERALKSFIASLSNTASPNYRHYLTTSQFAQRFGAPASSVAAVHSYLASFGLRVSALSKGHIVLHVSGSTADIARAFDAPVVTVRRSDGILAAQFTTRATLPASIAHDVSSVAGLSTVVAPHAQSIARRAVAHAATPGTCASAGSSAGSTPNSLGGYTIQQQAQLYGLSAAWATGNTGVGQTIGVYELGAYSPGDLATYFGCYGINPPLSSTNVDGGAVGGLSDEATLDIEEAGALTPGAAIQVYTGPNNSSGPTDVYQQMADDNTATIITTSWGDCETDPTGSPSSEQPIFEQMAAQGQTVITAAGDFGSSDCSGITNNNPAVDDPASQPYVTGVGGLNVSSISPLSQTVWNDGTNGGGGAGGGGTSQVWSRPSWQNAPGITSSATMRMVPDLSVMAAPDAGFIQYYSGSATGLCHRSCLGWSSIGGTSIGAPVVSALVAAAAQSCSVSRLGFINPSLYAMASTGYVDVTSGTNDLFGVGKYSAVPGFDMASGLGSPNGAAFIAGLCPLKVDLTKSSLTQANARPSISNGPASVTLRLHDTGNHPLVNASVHVTATASNGTIVLDGDSTSSSRNGAAAYDVTTNAAGAAVITVATTSPGPLALSATYDAQTLSTTMNFTSGPSAKTAPGKARIASLVALVGGFTLTVRASSNTGGRPITAYQYSIDAGVTWSTFSASTRVATTRKLAKGKRYRVIVRALNANGHGAPSAPSSVITRK